MAATSPIEQAVQWSSSPDRADHSKLPCSVRRRRRRRRVQRAGSAVLALVIVAAGAAMLWFLTPPLAPLGTSGSSELESPGQPVTTTPGDDEATPGVSEMDGRSAGG